MTDAHEITDLLRAWSNGNTEALQKLMPLVDHELHRIAHSYMIRERSGHTLQTTALIHEALMRFIQVDTPNWQNRLHFYSLVARRMRQVLVDHARERLAFKRGQRAEHVNISEAGQLSTEKSQELITLDAALTKLASIDERKSKIVEYRYFGGFTLPEVAEILEVSTATVEREWRLARSWLHREITA